MSKWNSPRLIRMNTMSKIEGGFKFVLKGILKDNPEIFSVSCMIIIIIYFSILIRISELDLLRFLIHSSTNFDVTQNLNFENFLSYQNCIWNMFITISTIGYGDFNVITNLSRQILLFISLSGLCTTSIAVVAYSEFFELDNQQ